MEEIVVSKVDCDFSHRLRIRLILWVGPLVKDSYLSAQRLLLTSIQLVLATTPPKARKSSLLFGNYSQNGTHTPKQKGPFVGALSRSGNKESCVAGIFWS